MKKKINKKNKSDLSRQFENAIILTLITLLVPICYYFFMAFHNLDLSYNVMRMESAINNADLYDANGTKVLMDFSKLMDKGSDFVERPLVDYYIGSLNNLSLFFMLGMFDSLALGIMISNKFRRGA